MNDYFGVVLVYFSSKAMFPLFLRFSKKVSYPNGPYLSTRQKEMPVFSSFEILSIVIVGVLCSASTACASTSLCKGLKYLLKKHILF